ncbi:hypothetical protein B0H14DRAFT_3160043 [Mycena olivaceomarginata]|nr:hypothetical protein B0H14DRAFT_3160043 [Mycena olivaceomarginata]
MLSMSRLNYEVAQLLTCTYQKLTVAKLCLELEVDFFSTETGPDVKNTFCRVTFNDGSELSWLAAFQTTLREVFAPDLSAEEWKLVVAVKSTSNIPIESTWSYDRKFNGRSMRDILEEGRIHLIPGDVVHSNKKTRKQRGRILPSGVAPNVVFDMPGDYGLENLAIPVAQEAIDELRTLIETSREEAYRWVSDEFDALSSEVYIQLGCPKLEALLGWAIFNAMAPFSVFVVFLVGSNNLNAPTNCINLQEL